MNNYLFTFILFEQLLLAINATVSLTIKYPKYKNKTNLLKRSSCIIKWLYRSMVIVFRVLITFKTSSVLFWSFTCDICIKKMKSATIYVVCFFNTCKVRKMTQFVQNVVWKPASTLFYETQWQDRTWYGFLELSKTLLSPLGLWKKSFVITQICRNMQN